MHTHLVGIFWDCSTANRLGDTGLMTQEKLCNLPPLGQAGRLAGKAVTG